MKELAVLALLAEAAEPVLADEGVEPARGCLGVGGCVALSAAGAVGAIACLEGAADGSICGEANLIGLTKERRESEVVDGAGMI